MSCVTPLHVPVRIPPRLVFLCVFRTLEVPRAFAACRVIFFLVSLVFRYQELSANQWYIARLALVRVAPSFASDATSSSFVSRFQRPGGSSLFFAYFSHAGMFGIVVV